MKKVPRKGEEKECPSKGAKRKKGRVKTGQEKLSLPRLGHFSGKENGCWNIGRAFRERCWIFLLRDCHSLLESSSEFGAIRSREAFAQIHAERKP